jgi:hypothetical protein
VLNYSQGEKYFRRKVYRKLQHSFSVQSRFSEILAVYEIMWENIAKSDRPSITIWRMRIACRTTTATDAHSEYVIHLDFPLQQRLQAGTSVLHLYVRCLSSQH